MSQRGQWGATKLSWEETYLLFCVTYRKFSVILFHHRVLIKPWCGLLTCNRSFSSSETLQTVHLQPFFILDIYEIQLIVQYLFIKVGCIVFRIMGTFWAHCIKTVSSLHFFPPSLSCFVIGSNFFSLERGSTRVRACVHLCVYVLWLFRGSH